MTTPYYAAMKRSLTQSLNRLCFHLKKVLFSKLGWSHKTNWSHFKKTQYTGTNIYQQQAWFGLLQFILNDQGWELYAEGLI